MPASISIASCRVSGLRKSTPETSPKKCGCNCRIEMDMAFLLVETGGCSRFHLSKKLLSDDAMSTDRGACRAYNLSCPDLIRASINLRKSIFDGRVIGERK